MPRHAYSPFDTQKDSSCARDRNSFAPGQVLIKFRKESVETRGDSTAVRSGVSSRLSGVIALEPVLPRAGTVTARARLNTIGGSSRGLDRWFRARLAPGFSVPSAVQALGKESSVEAVEPEYLRRLAVLPDATTDPRYGEQWHLPAIHAREAWQFLSDNGTDPGGRREIIVAVIDTGVDYNHPDLAGNIWTNGGEIAGNGIDDDHNGFVDDIHGVDVITNAGNPMDDHGHGTHVAGIIGAQGNNGTGIVGVAYNVQLMPIKAAQYSGVLSTTDIAEAVYYAVEKGADVINMSFGGYSKSQLEEDALAVAFGQAVLVAAAGNDSRVNLPCPFGADMYPAAYNWVLGVMASTQGGGLASFSNVDCTPHDTHEYELMAPGVDIMSTLPNGQYAAWDGTSMAAPVVSGIAALARSYFRDKDVYSSRFIMGQIASAGADAYAALATRPKPELTYLEHWLFDTAAQGATNDDDGVVDAGESLELAVVIRNHWGKADNVTVNLRAWAPLAYQDDPFVTITTPTVDYGAIGSFSWDDNGLDYDAEGAITGVRHPFRFAVSANCTNDHVIPFLLTMTTKNGLDPTDNTTYSFQSRFNLIVQRGRELPRIISESGRAFQDRADYTVGSYPWSVAAADFNGDSRLDLAVANRESHTVSILRNTDNGTFAAKVEYATGNYPSSVAAADLNRDSRPDLAVANYNSNTVSILFNSDNGTFAAKVDYATGGSPNSVAVADLNSDNRTDLAVANLGSNTVSILFNSDNGTFATKVDYVTGVNPSGVAIADFNGDSRPDLAVTNRGSDNVSILLNNGDGTFAPKVDYSTGSGPAAVAAADFNGDNRTDLAVADQWGGTVSVLLNNGDGTFGKKSSISVCSPPGLAVVDFNGDGYPDIVAACGSSGAVSILLNAGDGNFAGKGYAVAQSNYSVAVADFNGDSRKDLVTANTNGTVSVLLATGNLRVWDLVMTKDDFWIVPGQTLIEGNATVKISEGTQVQWGSPKPADPYSQPTTPRIQAEGTLLIQGTYDEPVELFPSPILGGNTYITYGVPNIKYARIRQPSIHLGYYCYGRLDHVYIDSDTGWGSVSEYGSHNVVTNSIVHKFRGQICVGELMDTCLFDNFSPSMSNIDPGQRTHNTVFLNNVGSFYFSEYVPYSGRLVNDAFLSKYWIPNPNAWMRFSAPSGRGKTANMANNYWGTTSTTLIDAAIYDYDDNFDMGRIVYQPILTVPAETTYPHVWKVDISQGGVNSNVLGPGDTLFTVAFNRDMDTSRQPQVSFGPDVPNTDYTIHPVSGGWQNPRVWKGTFTINPITGDGYQLMRIANARAASDPWLVTGDDSGRFRFEIITSGTEAMNLQATGGEGYVDLMWTQDDFDMLAGYNLYRSEAANGTYTRLNPGLILASQKTYRDRNVQPGKPYYYQFTVVKTDMHESKFSNVAAATPLDTIPPVITHTPVSNAPVGSGLTINADITDNVRVSTVSLYHRAIGATTYQSREMVKTTVNRYSATLEGSLVAPPGLEYYVEASDGVSTVQSGRADLPFRVAVTDAPDVTSVSPDRGPTGGGTFVTISGSNFKAGASVTFGGAVAGNVTQVSGNQLTCLTPPHLPGTVDVAVANPGGGTGTLLRAFTYQSGTVPVSLPDVVAARNAIIGIPVTASNVEGLLAAHVVVRFDRDVLAAQGARTGTLTAGFSTAVNMATPGEISVSLASATAVSGSGTLTSIDFLVTGTPGSSSNITLAGVTLNDGAIPVLLDDGTVRVEDLLSLSGWVRYYNAGLPVSNVTMALGGDSAMSQATNELGNYTLTNMAHGNYTLTPQKSDNTSAVTSYDASLILQASVGLINLSAMERKAADVDRSDNVTPMDAAYVLQKSSWLIELPFPGAGKVWDFEPASRSYQPLSGSLANQDFTAVLIGDVSGNWGRSVAKPGRTAAAELSIAQVPASPSGQVTVPLALATNGARVFSADLVLSYDPSVVSAVRATKSALSDSFSMAVNLSRSGEVRVAMAGATPIASGGDLITITFDVVGVAGRTSPLQIVAAELNEGSVPAQLSGGGLVVASGQVLPGLAKITNIQRAPAAYANWQVTLSGEYRGWEAGHGSSPVTRSDWVMKDDTGYVYVTGNAMGLRHPADIGKRIALSGTVRVKNGQAYIEARATAPPRR